MTLNLNLETGTLRLSWPIHGRQLNITAHWNPRIDGKTQQAYAKAIPHTERTHQRCPTPQSEPSA